MVTLDELSLPSRFAAAVVSYATYLGQFFWPTNLAAFYPHPAARLPIGEAAAALLLLTAISAAVIIRRRPNPYLFVGWFWFLGMLVPVIGLVQVGLQVMADRYGYLPQIGLAIALAWSAAAADREFLSAGKLPSYRPWTWGIVSGLVLAGLMACAWRQTSFWRDSETLWTRAVRCTTDNDVAHFNLAAELMKQQRYSDAIEHYLETVRIRPAYPHAQCNLAFALNRQGQTQEAIAHYYQAIKYDPGDRYALGNLASLRATSPQAAIRNGVEAVELAQRAFRLSNGREPGITATLAAAYAEAGRFPDAIRAARQAIAQAKQQNNRALVKDAEAQLRLYIAGKPYRRPLPSARRPDAR